jgi:type IV secretory pathway TrbD component
MSQSDDFIPPGWEVPVHRSLTQPLLRAGLPPTLAIVIWSISAGAAFAYSQIWVVPIGALVHVACARLTRHDPYFFQILPQAIWGQNRLEL